MTRRRIVGLSALAALAATAGLADEIAVTDAYIRAASPTATTAAAFMTLENPSDTDDRLVAVTSTIARKIQLHTHIEGEDGVMMMRHDVDGFEIPAHGMAVLARGGDHVMFMGLGDHLEQGATVTLTLEFENAEPLTVEIPVDHERRPTESHGHGMTNVEN